MAFKVVRVAPAPAAPVAPPPGESSLLDDSLDALLRFTGDARAAAALESAFVAAHARNHRLGRSVCLAFMGAAYALAFIALAVTSTPVPSDWGYLAVAGACFGLVPVVRGRAPLWGVGAGSSAASALVLFAFNFNGGAATPCSTGRYTDLMMYLAMPLIAGVMFTPRWRLYGVMCVAHAARGAVQLAPLGAMPPLVVGIASCLGCVLAYLQEKRSREHFVSGGPGRAGAVLRARR